MPSSHSPARLLGSVLLASLLGACAASSPPKSAAPSGTSAAQPSRPPAAGAAPAPNAAFAQGSKPEADWISAARPDLRALTVVVRASPPRPLGAKLRELARRYKPLSELFVASAEEAFGSGFVMVRRGLARRGEPRVFVVTNRHVVGLATRVLVEFEKQAGLRPLPAEVVYVHDVYDLAVLALPPGAADVAGIAEGFALAATPARDQDEVVASGFPGIASKPSYQVTRGFVSNERFLFEDAAGRQQYVQHTAPIDPGSSGGPLTTPDGKILGVNTLKIRGREGVGMAVPAKIVAEALAEAARDRSEPPDAACDALLANTGAGAAALPALERALGAGLVAEHGLPSLPSLPPNKEEWAGRFVEDPIAVFARAIALRLQQTRSEPGARCVPVRSEAPESVFKAQLGGKEQLLVFAREQGRWKLTQAALGRAQGRSFLDHFDAKRRPAKKWKPTLR